MCETIPSEIVSRSSCQELKIPDWRDHAALDSVTVASLAHADASLMEQIAHYYSRTGLVRIVVTDKNVGVEGLRYLRNGLGLGEAYTLPQYATFAGLASDGVSRMTSTRAEAPTDCPAGEVVVHPSFHTTNGQLLHCDGTLEPLGSVKTTLLACQQEAASGGATNFLNTTQALKELARVDGKAADALFAQGILTRTTNIAGAEGSVTDRAFALVDGELTTRASFSGTDTWAVPGDASGPDVARGLCALLENASKASPLYRRVQLCRGQIVIFANDKLSHGRDGFVNTPERTRDVLRMLFRGRPRAGEVNVSRL